MRVFVMREDIENEKTQPDLFAYVLFGLLYGACRAPR